MSPTARPVVEAQRPKRATGTKHKEKAHAIGHSRPSAKHLIQGHAGPAKSKP